jgi:hypothetical protein
MRKLSLSLEDLQVESFGTTPPPETRGTVHGNSGCCYSGDDCTEYWSTCNSGPADTQYYCPVTGMDSCGETACSCSADFATCAQMGCPLSYHTDCHRC